MRNHPAVNYYKSGIPIVIAGDDPGSFGYNELTVDYYMAFLAWGLDLYDLKTIANNSIKYSVLPEPKRAEGYFKFQAAWNTFIDQMFTQVCEKAKSEPVSISKVLNATDLLPNFGPRDASMDIQLYGYGFDFAFCKEITCLFDQVATNGSLHKLGQIRCATPLGQPVNHTANLSISVDGVAIPTGFTYTFVESDSLNLVNDDECWNFKVIFAFKVSICLQSFKFSFGFDD